MMGDGAGIFRDKEGLSTAINQLDDLAERGANVKSPSERLDYNPGWQLCREVRNMITVAQAIAKAALMREESRGGHSRLDHAYYDDYWSEHNIIVDHANDEMVLKAIPVAKKDDLSELIEARKEQEKAA